MKRHFLVLSIAAVLILSAQTFAAAAPVLPGNSPSVREVALSQIYRYAREMYRAGNYPEAIKSFKEMLAIDCSNKIAQYHLMKIAQKTPEYAELDAFLKALPCGQHNFEEEDFLPASLYYTADTDLLQEQLTVYNKRYRIAKSKLEDAADNYTKLTKELEDEIESLRQQVAAAKAKPAKEMSELTKKLAAAKDTAARMDQEVAKLKKQLADERARSENEAALLQSRMAKGAPASPSADVRAKELELQAKEQELSTLQQKFEDIQRRLQLIQTSVEEKNTAIKAMQSAVSDVAAPDAVKSSDNPNER